MKKWISFVLVAAAALAFGMFLHGNRAKFGTAFWQRQVSPGPLSPGHAFLERNCAACHAPVQSADSVKCVACHATNERLLQRQPTAFHSSIGNCRECHAEHQRVDARPTAMDHATLAKIGLRILNKAAPDSEQKQVGSQLLSWMRLHGSEPTAANHPQITAIEMTLDCWSCHSTKDRHSQFFGRDCAACHGTTQWTIAGFRHPSPRSIDCAQCHQAPPSHYMEHFRMISQRIAGEEHADVKQCYLCHQTTSWNDIRGVGWYKHH